jgi:16S rRNA (cytosine1402-N4)-methyltransferase
MYSHIPVLLQPALKFLDPKPGQNFVDATLGGGGYTTALLEQVKPSGKVLSIDMDQDALVNFKSIVAKQPFAKNSILAHGNFADLAKIVEHHEYTDIQGIVADIGLSSYQLDQSGRGISFQKDEPLDMRFDVSSEREDARFLLNNWTEAELAKIFRQYGEENNASRLARAIVKQRSDKLFKTTFDLVEVIKDNLPKPQQHRWTDTARRVFQALRIAVNHELSNLETFLPQALDLISPGGVLVVVTFHSLEDRIVKQFFQDASRGCVCPPDFPQCVCGREPQARILTKKPVTASEQELQDNSRSKPAKLRALVKS